MHVTLIIANLKNPTLHHTRSPPESTWGSNGNEVRCK